MDHIRFWFPHIPGKESSDSGGHLPLHPHVLQALIDFSPLWTLTRIFYAKKDRLSGSPFCMYQHILKIFSGACLKNPPQSGACRLLEWFSKHALTSKRSKPLSSLLLCNLWVNYSKQISICKSKIFTIFLHSFYFFCIFLSLRSHCSCRICQLAFQKGTWQLPLHLCQKQPWNMQYA